ncbi:MAG: class I tRNA ligase family protein, partial [Clostridia bacterium]|nr:class I tRNA ligase family protein [Clostridia bacterium]
GPWSDDGIRSVSKFMERIERIVEKTATMSKTNGNMGKDEKELDYARNYAIKQITRDMEAFSFNTCVARLMELTNAVYKYEALPEKNEGFFRSVIEDLVKLIAPAAPAFAEELWEKLGHTDNFSIFNESYPVCNEAALVKNEVEYAVQVNSRIKCKMMIESGLTNEQIQAAACANAEIAPLLEGKTVKKCIIVPGRLINLIIG